jgi:NADPH:quinone reductase-like Zn-dependent oxidoreductase
MRKVLVTEYGDSDALVVVDEPPPIALEQEVCIEVRAIGVSFDDIYLRRGRYDNKYELPVCPGHEVSGVVTAIGPGVNKSLLGKPVIALLNTGAYASEVVTPLSQIWLKPEELTFEQGAAMPIPYLMAYQALMVIGRLKPSESILIHNMGGALGLALLDLACYLKSCRIIGTASAFKHDFLFRRGAHHLIDYTTADWHASVMALTEGKGVEYVADSIGGEHWNRSYECLRASGRLAMMGMTMGSDTSIVSRLNQIRSSARPAFMNPMKLIRESKGVLGVHLSGLWQEHEKVRKWMDHLLFGVREGWISPHVDQTFSLEDAGKAQATLENRKNTGKVILKP